MTSNRFPPSAGHSPTCTRIALLLLLGAALAIAASSACGSTSTTTNDFIGVTDATAPRLGQSDGGSAL